MNIRIYTLLIILGISIHSNATSNSINSHIKFNLTLLNKDKYDIEIRLFDSFLGAGYHTYKTFSTNLKNSSIDLSLPEISMGIIAIKHGDEIISYSGTVIFNGDTLFVEPEPYKTILQVKGGENEFMQNNFTLPFNLPSRIKDSKSFKPKIAQRTYDLQIPEDPMLQAIYKEYLRNVLSTVKQYPDSYHILSLLNKNADNISIKTLDTALAIFDENIINTVAGRKLKTIIANGKWLINKPDLNTVPIVSVSEKELSLGSIIDSTKYTFIDFWASWCVPCRAFSTSLAQKYAELDTNAIQIISISLDEDTNKWKKALTKDQLPWLNFIDPSYKGFEGDLAQLFNIQFIPQSFLFDKKGNIVQRNLSIDELMKIGKE